MNYNEVKELIGIIDSSSLTSFELSIDNVSVKMSKNSVNSVNIGVPATAAAPAEPVTKALNVPMVIKDIPPKPEDTAVKEEDKSGEIVKAPIVGTFYAAAGANKPPFVSVGDQVKKGDTLCILEAMKIMNEVPSPYDGQIAEIYVENESLVEYGQPLFRIK